MKYYVLDKHYNPKEATLEEWATGFGSMHRAIAQHRINDITASTVFIGLDHELFETMIFGGSNDQFQRKSNTHADALAAHASACELAFGPHWQTLIKIAEIRGEQDGNGVLKRTRK